MLLKLEAEVDRQYLVEGVRERGRRKYEGLKAKIVDRGSKNERIIDRIVRHFFQGGIKVGAKGGVG